MTVEQAFRNMIRSEVEDQLRAMREELAALRDVAERLAPLANVVGPFFGGRAGAGAAAGGARRGPGRPRGAGSTAAARTAGGTTGRRGRPPRAAVRGCAIDGCKRPARSKGYCAAHYQKRRMLQQSGRLPSEWKDDAAPGSVKDLKLPRGRAASKAKQAAAQG